MYPAESLQSRWHSLWLKKIVLIVLTAAPGKHLAGHARLIIVPSAEITMTPVSLVASRICQKN